MDAQVDRKFIDQLTGLRFVAAASVAVGHAAPSLRDDWLGHLVAQISSVGMTLFFVLSGFVLWITYSERMLRSPWAALRDFATARFARLYPMYALVVIVIAGYLVIRRNQDPASLFFILTMTQAWFPEIKGTMLAGAIPPIKHLWSISVELLFYLLFPIACFSFGQIKSVRKLAWLSVLNVAAFAIAIALSFIYGNAFLHTVVPTLHDGMAWLTYYSPYLHMSQFVAGCLIAQIYLKLASVSVTESMRAQMRASFLLSAAGLLSAPVLLFIQPSWPSMSFWIEIGVRLDEVICFSIIILAIAGFGCARSLGSKMMVVGGECSYSIYLLHPFLFHFAIIGKSEFSAAPEFVARLILFIAIATAVAWLFYTLVEVPSKRWLRRTLRSNRKNMTAPNGTSVMSLK